MSRELIISHESGPFVLAAYVVQAVCAEWPDAQASADAVLRGYEREYGPFLRTQTFNASVTYHGRGFTRNSVHCFLGDFAKISPFAGAVAEALRAPFVDRWLAGSECGDQVFGLGLVVDLLGPLARSPAFVRGGGWAQVRPALCGLAEAETQVPADVWRGVLDARREAKRTLRFGQCSAFSGLLQSRRRVYALQTTPRLTERFGEPPPFVRVYARAPVRSSPPPPMRRYP